MPRPRENPGDISYDRPQVRILDDAQWLFIRKYFRISPRELEVARYVCSGFSNEEIAAKLKIRSATVKTHLRNVYRRIHVQRKLDMLLKFLDQSSRHFASSRQGTSVPVKEPRSYGSQREVNGNDGFTGD
ncbi:MAG: helix-turn-helix transcriptional regulator [Sedimentisphaerales bacterium]|nr:helix-turn-helix transcriptional regulator [Sedimentisphaerales bacterium]